MSNEIEMGPAHVCDDCAAEIADLRAKLEAAEKWHANLLDLVTSTEKQRDTANERADRAERDMRDMDNGRKDAINRSMAFLGERDSLRAQLAEHRKLIWMPLDVREGTTSPEEWYLQGQEFIKATQAEREEWATRARESQSAVAALHAALEELVATADDDDGYGDSFVATCDQARSVLASTSKAAKRHDTEVLEKAARLVETIVLNEACESRPQVAEAIRALTRDGEQG